MVYTYTWFWPNLHTPPESHDQQHVTNTARTPKTTVPRGPKHRTCHKYNRCLARLVPRAGQVHKIHAYGNSEREFLCLRGMMLRCYDACMQGVFVWCRSTSYTYSSGQLKYKTLPWRHSIASSDKRYDTASRAHCARYW